MKSSLRWKSACAAVATIALCNIPLLAQQAMAAPPPICIQWAWSKCDPKYPDRFSPEWGACFEYWSEAGCPWWDGTLTERPPMAVKLEDMEKLVRQ